jgi:hypothetical protein
MRAAVLELHLTVLDPGEPRERWNGDPMASAEASAAIREEVDAMKERLRERGFTPAHTGMGIKGASW